MQDENESQRTAQKRDAVAFADRLRDISISGTLSRNAGTPAPSSRGDKAGRRHPGRWLGLDLAIMLLGIACCGVPQRLAAAAAGEPLPSGLPDAPGSFGAAAVPPGVLTGEWTIEADYGFKARPGVTIVSDVQLVGRPAAVKTIPDALVLAGRLEVNL